MHIGGVSMSSTFCNGSGSFSSSMGSYSSSPSSLRGSHRVSEKRAWASGIDEAEISCHTLSV